MNKQIQTLIKRIKLVNTGEPWFGRAAWSILEQTDTTKVFLKPYNTGHSLIELIYHMITWSDFTLKRIEKDKINDLVAAEELDWRTIDPRVHSWQKGLAEFKAIQKKIITLLTKKDDAFLEEIVDYREYDFRFLINGMIEHTIYHIGQIAYVNKIL